MRKNCSSDWEKLLKFEAEGREFAKNLRSLEQFFLNSERSDQFLVTEQNRTVIIQIGKNYWNLKTYRRS